MGRLLDPGLGEIVDRQTILVLKCTRAAPGANVTHFQKELTRLQTTYTDRARITEEIRQRIAQLQHVNIKLWEAEDTMAEYAADFDQTDIQQVVNAAALGVYIWEQNRERNRLIAEINRLAGTDHGPEKL